MKTVTFFDGQTGEFGAVVSMPDRAFSDLARPFKEGRFDRLSQRVDLASGEVVDRVLTEDEKQRHAKSLAHRKIVAEMKAKRHH